MIAASSDTVSDTGIIPDIRFKAGDVIISIAIRSNRPPARARVQRYTLWQLSQARVSKW